MKYRVLLMVAAMVGLFSASTGATAASGVHVLQGSTYKTMIFPNNLLTTPDSSQLTGLRINFREGVDYPACDATNYSVCDAFGELNRIDGFDIDDGNFYITDAAGALVSGMRQVTFDPVTHTLAGISDKFLKENTTYHVRVAATIKDTTGAAIDACGGSCDATFTTRNASRQLVSIRDALDSGAAYTEAGITDRRASFNQGGTDDVFLAASVAPSIGGPANGIQRIDNAAVSPADPKHLVTSTVPNLVPPGTAGYYAFGSFESPRYQYRSNTLNEDTAYTASSGGPTDGEINPVPSTQAPPALGKDRLGLIVITPDPVLFPPPWPAAVYGPGFTRSKFDIFVTADYNASLGIATLATDPSGHGYGPESKITVTSGLGTQTTFSSYGRGRDLDGNGCIGAGLLDGVGPTDHKSAVTGSCGPAQVVGSDLPSHKPIDGLQSGLVQTVVDNMALVRSIEAGMTIPGAGDLKTTNVAYYGLSFGGIYGTMLVGTDSHVHQALLNVPGGPIVDIARLSSFRGNLQNNLKVSKPNMLNGGPGLDGFTEDLPLRNDPYQVITHPGALALQELFGLTNWYNRSGSPETFAPRIRLRPDPLWKDNPKNVVFQTAYGDGTVPNPTAGTLYRAGQLFDRVVYYRNDKTPTYNLDPHGWLADPTLAGRTSGEQQLGAFLATGQLLPTNPAILETPIVDPNNLECLHYPDPQSGVDQVRQPFPASGSCPVSTHGGTPSGGGPAANRPRIAGDANGPSGLPNTSGLNPDLPVRLGEALLLGSLATVLLAVGRRRRRQSGR